MTEKEYIDRGDLKSIQMIKRLLHDIVPEISEVIETEPMRQILGTLGKWETGLYKECEIE